MVIFDLFPWKSQNWYISLNLINKTVKNPEMHFPWLLYVPISFFLHDCHLRLLKIMFLAKKNITGKSWLFLTYYHGNLEIDISLLIWTFRRSKVLECIFWSYVHPRIIFFACLSFWGMTKLCFWLNRTSLGNHGYFWPITRKISKLIYLFYFEQLNGQNSLSAFLGPMYVPGSYFFCMLVILRQLQMMFMAKKNITWQSWFFLTYSHENLKIDISLLIWTIKRQNSWNAFSGLMYVLTSIFACLSFWGISKWCLWLKRT